MIKISKEKVTDRKSYILSDYMSNESRLYLLPNGSIYKEFKGSLIHEKRHRVRYLINKFKYVDNMPKGLVMPTKAVYDNRQHLIGYITDKVDVMNIEKLEERKSPYDRTDLKMYREVYYKLKNILVSAGDNIVFPNLLDTRNIFMDKNGNISLICFDDMQIDGIEGYFGSDTEYYYGGPELKSKKYFNNGLYTKNMDIRSLIFIYFKYAFNFNLSVFSSYNEEDLEDAITRAFYNLGIDDTEIVKKVEKLFLEDVDNEYIDDFVDYITEEHQLYSCEFSNNKPIKRLTLK